MICPACSVENRQGAKFCDSCGASTAEAPTPAADDGERRHATVVFSDLSGYTALSERLDPEDVGEDLRP